jgi:hypothetical protein
MKNPKKASQIKHFLHFSFSDGHSGNRRRIEIEKRPDCGFIQFLQ